VDNDTANHVRQVWESFIHHWQFYGTVIAVLFWSIVWALKNRFVSHAQLRACKTDVSDDAAVVIAQNTKEHKEIRDDIAEKHSELLKIILEKHH
jgi:hypothetical protein